MAIRAKIQDGEGAVGQLPDIALQDGKLTEKQALTVSAKIQQIIGRLNNGLSLGTGQTAHQAGNLDAQYVDVLMGDADAEVAIPHGLGRRPIGYWVVRRDRACIIYDSSNGSWSSTLLYLRSDTASATIRLLVF